VRHVKLRTARTDLHIVNHCPRVAETNLYQNVNFMDSSSSKVDLRLFGRHLEVTQVFLFSVDPEIGHAAGSAA